MKIYRDDCVHYRACIRLRDRHLQDANVYLPLECWDCTEYVARSEMMNCFWDVVWMGEKIAKSGSETLPPAITDSTEGGYPF